MAHTRLGSLAIPKEYSNNIINVSGSDARIQFGDQIAAPAAEKNQPSWQAVSRWIFAPKEVFDQKAFQSSAQKKRKEPSTGAWLLDGPAFKKWQVDEGSFLWLEGKMGCGKTILCSTAVKRLQDICAKRESEVVAYHYFTYTDARSQIYDTLLKSLVLQLGRCRSSSRQVLIDAYDEADCGGRALIDEELKEHLKSLLGLFQSVYIILDALDECSERRDVFDFLEELHGWKIPGVRVLLSSKTMEEIQEAVATYSVTRVHVQSSVVDDDIRKHVAFQLSNNRDLRKRWNEVERLEIENRLTSSSDGIFQWTVAPLAEISQCRTEEALYQALDSLPKSLNEAYERALCSVEDQYSKDTLKLLLQWLLCSCRPLRLEELAEVVAIDASNRPYLKAHKRLKLPKEIFDLCTCLVTLDTEPSLTNEELTNQMFALNEEISGDKSDSSVLHDKSILRLAHSSVIEYLTGDDIKNGPASEYKLDQARAHPLLAEASLAYIVNFDLCDFEIQSKEAQHAFPLLGYAMEFWFDHASRKMADDERTKLETLISEALKTRWEVYRHFTYLPKVPKYDTWPSPELNIWKESGDRRKLCEICSKLTIEKLKDPSGILHRTYDELKQFSTSCGLCRLIYAALGHFAAMKSLQKRTHHLQVGNNLANDLAFQEVEIGLNCGSRRVRLIAEPRQPFLFVHLSCHFGRLHLFANPGDALSRLIPGRPINMNPNCDAVFQQVSQWLKECETTHRACASALSPSGTTFVPRRLIQVDTGDDSQVRLVEMRIPVKKATCYATLTHCWGTRYHFPKTTSSNYQKFQMTIPLPNLSRNFIDAINVTRALGICYLWIDALCIIQDSKSDWQQEAENIAKYYKHGILNLVSGTPESDVGMFGSRWEPRVPTVYMQQSRGVLGFGWLGTEAFSSANGRSVAEFPDNWRYLSPPHRRAWLLQEIRFAPRNLVYQSNEVPSSLDKTLLSAQLYLQCHEQIRWENGRQTQLENAPVTDEHRAWCLLVEQYTSSHLTYSIDKLPAISALAREYADRTQDQYCAGLWRADLLSGLLWRRHPKEQRETSYDSHRAPPAPSWSWASMLGRIEYPWPMETESKAEVIECSIELGRGPYANILGGRLRLLGFTRLFTLPGQGTGCVQNRVDIEEQIDGGRLNIRCWLDSIDYLEGSDRRVMALRITKRLGLVLIHNGEILEENFGGIPITKRIGIMVIANQDIRKWELSSEQREIVIV
ncbi:hypothetical protein V8E51_005447 [Hyaloscypha variabilis]